MRFQFEIFGDTIIDRKLMRMADSLEDAAPFFLELADDFAQIEEAQFNSQGERGGERWAPLAESTIAGKAAAGLDPRILHATLALRDSLTHINTDGNETIIEPGWMVFRSTVPYGIYHHTGTDNMPKRDPFVLTEEDKVNVMRKLQRWIKTGELIPL